VSHQHPDVVKIILKIKEIVYMNLSIRTASGEDWGCRKVAYREL
jgi:hypothetical protein